MTASTCMYWTRRDPDTGEGVFVATAAEASVQRALVQYRDPRNKARLVKYMQSIEREDVIREFYGNWVEPSSPRGPKGEKPRTGPRAASPRPGGPRAADKKPHGGKPGGLNHKPAWKKPTGGRGK